MPKQKALCRQASLVEPAGQKPVGHTIALAMLLYWALSSAQMALSGAHENRRGESRRRHGRMIIAGHA